MKTSAKKSASKKSTKKQSKGTQQKRSRSGISKEERKEALRNRTEENTKNKDNDNSFGARIIDLSRLGDNHGFEYWKPKAGTLTIDILPYLVKTKNHPQKLKPGYEDYLLDVWVHGRVGPSEGSYICLKKNFGKPCPICEERDELQSSGNATKDELSALNPKRRCVYNIKDLDSDEDKIYIWEVSHFLFEKELLEEAETAEDGEIVTFADLEDGKHIQFRARDEKYKTTTYLKFKKFDFIDRDEEYDESIFDQVVSLDEVLVIPTYEEVRDAFYGVDDDDDDDDEEDIDDVEEEEDDEDEAPRKKKKPSKKVEDDDDEEEEDEEPKSKKKSSKKAKKVSECPHGHNFGEDCDEYEDCDECKAWNDCLAVLEEE